MSPEEEKFYLQWEKDRIIPHFKRKPFLRGLSISLSLGLLILIISETGWYERATMVGNMQGNEIWIVIAIIAFCIITVIYFSPVFKGKVIKSHDIMQHKGASKEIVDYRKETGEEALWTNAMFGGMPAYQISTLYPNNFLKHIDSALKLYLPHPAGTVFMYFLNLKLNLLTVLHLKIS